MLLFTGALYAQGQTVRLPLYFITGSWQLSAEDAEKLAKFIAQQQQEITSVIITGHTDAVAGSLYNQKLSAKRAKAVQAVLPAKLQSRVFFLGETEPAANNSTPAGRRQNRRVEVMLTLSGEKTNSGSVDATAATDEKPWRTIAEMYAELQPEAEAFCIDNTKDTLLTTKGGSLLHIKAGTYEIPAGCSCITILVGEAFSNADIISQNLNTMNDGSPLISGGMIKVEATWKERPVPFAKGKGLLAMTPSGPIPSNAGLFDGEFDSTGQINWAKDDDTLRGKFAAMDACLAGKNDIKPAQPCDTCPLFFCGLGRKIKGFFSARQRQINDTTKTCNGLTKAEIRRIRQRNAELAVANQKRFSALNSEDQKIAAWVTKQFGWPIERIFSLPIQCRNLYRLLYKNGITDLVSFGKALEKQIEALSDGKESEKMDLLKSLQYNAFEISGNGWKNIDWLLKLDPNKCINFLVQPNAVNQYSDCKLIFKLQKTTIQTIPVNNQYIIGPVPANLAAYLIFFEIRPGSKDTWFGIQEITTGKGTFTVPLSPQSIGAIRKALETLNKP